MRKIFLHGELGDFLGKEWSLDVDSVQEAFCAIEANTNKFTKFLAENSEKFKYYTFQVDGEYLKSKKELESKLPKAAKNIHIMPQIAGGDPVSILINVVIAVATSLIMQALFKPPKAKEQKETRSYMFAGTQNVAAQGIPVPLGYGRLKVGSAVVSASTRNVDYYSLVFKNRQGGAISPNLPMQPNFNAYRGGMTREVFSFINIPAGVGVVYVDTIGGSQELPEEVPVEIPVEG